MKRDPSHRLHAADDRERIRTLRTSHVVDLFPSLSPRLNEADITAEHWAALVVWLGLGPLLALAGWLLLGSAWALLSLVLVGMVPLAFVTVRSGRRTRQVVALLPDSIDMIARSLRSGATLRAALVETSIDAPRVIGDEFRAVVRSIERGNPLPAALREWADRSPSPEVRIVAAALSLASVNEAGTVQGLEGVAQSLRDRMAVQSEVKSLTAQASVSMQALVLLPIGFLAIDAAGSRRVVRLLLHDRVGQLCLGMGLTLNIVGWLWMQRLISRRMAPR